LKKISFDEEDKLEHFDSTKEMPAPNKTNENFGWL
jgi:hypothetical protein